MKPLGVMLVCSALLVSATAIDNPILLASIAACALALLLAGPGSKRAYLVFAGTSALLVFLINPFVSVQGLTRSGIGPIPSSTPRSRRRSSHSVPPQRCASSRRRWRSPRSSESPTATWC